MKKTVTSGAYHLVLRLKLHTTVRVGRLGPFTFPPGYYVYTGSAMNGLEARLARHRRQRKNLRWHIDYLLRHAEIVSVVTKRSRDRIECSRNQSVLALTGASIVASHFGASDCRCRAHLIYFGAANLQSTRRRKASRVTLAGMLKRYTPDTRVSVYHDIIGQTQDPRGGARIYTSPLLSEPLLWRRPCKI